MRWNSILFNLITQFNKNFKKSVFFTIFAKRKISEMLKYIRFFFYTTCCVYVAFLGELKHVLSLSKPKIIFCSPRTIEKMVGILPDHPYIQRLVLFGKEKSEHQDVIMYQELIEGTVFFIS